MTPAKKEEEKEGKGELENLISTLRDKFGEGAIMMLGEARKVDVAVIPTGSFSLDIALGVGGLPRGRIVEIYGPESSGKCINKNSLILSEDGILPIGEFGDLKKRGFQKREKYVYAENCFEKTSYFYNEGNCNTIKVDSHYGFSIEGTPNHRIRVMDKEGNYLWRRLDELEHEDHIAIQRGQRFFGKGVDVSKFKYTASRFNTNGKPFSAPRTITRELAMLLGYLVGDGTTTRTGLNKNNIQLTSGDPETTKDFTGVSQAVFGETPKITKDKRTVGTARLVIHNARARAFLEHVGLGWNTAGEKEIPWTILRSHKKIVSAFLSALYECDGCFSGATIEYCTKSEKLARQLQVVFLNYGIVTARKTRIVKGAPYYYLYIDGQRDKKLFLKEIGFRSARKNNLLRADTSKQKMPQTNVDVIPNINNFFAALFEKFGIAVRKTNRADWKVAYDYLPAPRGGGIRISYDRLDKILKHFETGRNLPEYQRLEQLRELNFFYDKIEKISQSVAHVVDFTIPKGATFFANGFVNHNTTLALNVVAQAQKQGGKTAFIDAEHALDPEYAAKLGVKVNDLLISQPDNGEEALNILDSLVRSGIISVIVVDSVAALTPRAELEGEMGDQHIGRQARMMAQALRKLTAIANQTQTTIIFINQLRMKIGVMFGCLNYKSKVTLANGKQEWIGKIVNQKLPVEVLSYDWKKKKIVPSKVTGWYKNGKTEKFLQITVYDPSGNGVAQLSCTPNHPILTPVGWQRAENLKAGSRVLIATTKYLSEFQLEIIRGSLLGDGNLSPTIHKQSMGTRFRMGHGLKQKNYLLWKAKLFGNIPHSKYEDKKSIKLDLTPLPELHSMKMAMYRAGYKFLTPDFLSKLTPLSLAVWYQDDAGLDVRNKARTKGRVAICIQAIHPDSRVQLQALLEERYGIKTRLGVVRGQHILYFNQENSEKFMQLIKYYVHPSMAYKLLPQYRYKLNVSPQFSKPEQVTTAVTVLKIVEKPRTRSMMRFDIGVQGHHNFLADNIVVHNSPETTPGGMALKFAASVRLDIRRIAQVKKGEEVIGSRVRAKVVKNKVAPPFRTSEFDILYNEGISYEADVLNAGIRYGVVSKSGASYSFEGEKLGSGFENVRLKLKEDKKLLGAIKSKITHAVKEGVAGTKSEGPSE